MIIDEIEILHKWLRSEMRQTPGPLEKKTMKMKMRPMLQYGNQETRLCGEKGETWEAVNHLFKFETPKYGEICRKSSLCPVRWPQCLQWLTWKYRVMVRRIEAADIPMYPLNNRTFFPTFSITMNCNSKRHFQQLTTGGSSDCTLG